MNPVLFTLPFGFKAKMEENCEELANLCFTSPKNPCQVYLASTWEFVLVNIPYTYSIWTVTCVNFSPHFGIVVCDDPLDFRLFGRVIQPRMTVAGPNLQSSS